MSENSEATLVALAAASGAVASYVAAQPIPNEIKIPVCTILGAFSVGVLAYWKTKVNKFFRKQ